MKRMVHPGMTRPAVFLDRDGVLNEVVPRDGQPGSPRSVAELKLAADLSAVTRLTDAGLLVFIITNQPDIARGHTTTAELERMMALLREHVHIDDYRVCPHQDADGCDCRKPRPGMLHDLARGWHVALDRSFVIGDMWRDVEAARAAGCTSVLIRRDYNAGAQSDLTADSLTGAVAAVLSHAE